ncbi:FxDxF family PEP-CTERM protein [Uliginosibacterium sp. H1]|uniref:FxDxF family PEP-CTERM protein n=1 Tax=Uliginosibacterium sp. H1 TaxID=3114757 RepID=UPI002E17DDE3|nr:FxDxF family PEP-CTERM protein [Uliginosibacterium sp. H1]
MITKKFANRFFAVLVAVGLTAGASLNAQAVSWGQHNSFESASLDGGLMSEIYSFELLSSSDIVSTAYSNFLGLGIVSLFSGVFGDGAADVMRGGYLFSQDTAGNSYSFASLAPGSYYYSLQGFSLGGTNFTSTIAAAVPEAETYLMFLAGLGMIGLVVRRRLS